MKDEVYLGGEPLDDGWWSAVLDAADEDLRSKEIPAGKILPEIIPVGQANIRMKSNRRNEHGETDIDWALIASFNQKEAVLDCKVTDHNRGGVLVSCVDFIGFVPVSHLVRIIEVEEDQKSNVLQSYVGQTIQAKVIECDPARGRIVLSERAAQAAPGQRNKLFSNLTSNAKVLGTITNLTDFGVFVDLGGVEGLAHISELSWGRVTDPGKLFSIGQEVEVLVLRVDRDKGRVSLSIKRLTENPWDAAPEKYPLGEKILVTVSEVVPFGAFARLSEGLEGLIHISEMGLDEGVRPDEILQKDEQVWVSVLSVDADKQRLSLRLEI